MAKNGDTLVVGPSWVGDMVMAQTLFKCLKARAPEAAIDVLAPAWSNPLLERMPEVRSAINLPFGHGEFKLTERWELGKRLQKTAYSKAIVLPNSLKSALIPFFADIPVRTGWRGEMRFFLLNDIRLLVKSRYPKMIERFAALAFPPNTDLPADLPFPQLSISEREVDACLQKFSLNQQRQILAICPGAEFGPSKRWPEEHYAEIANRKIAAGWQVWIFGSANDSAGAAKIREQLAPEHRHHCHLLAGSTTLAEAIDLLSATDAVVSNDSGLMHVAAALERPLVVVYGSTSPVFTPPLSDNVSIQSVAVDCGPCFQRDCPKGHLKCQWGVKPDRVESALNELMNR